MNIEQTPLWLVILAQNEPYMGGTSATLDIEVWLDNPTPPGIRFIIPTNLAHIRTFPQVYPMTIHYPPKKKQAALDWYVAHYSVLRKLHKAVYNLDIPSPEEMAIK